MPSKYLIISDLDATLLDHYTYSWEAATEALGHLKNLKIPLILCSSKTASEMKVYWNELKLDSPFISENGAAVSFPFLENGIYKFRQELFSDSYENIVRIANELREKHNFLFKGFSDLNAEAISELTGLSLEASILASQRDCSEPISWYGNEESLKLFEELLRDRGLSLTKGGRFYHIKGSFSKGTTLKWLIEKLSLESKSKDILTVALGDGRNDKEMLELVDYSIVIKSHNGTYLALDKEELVFKSKYEGPKGWNEEIIRFLKSYSLL